MKKCTRCKKNKKLIEYYKTGKYYRSECKNCSIKAAVDYSKKNRKRKKRFCIDCQKKITNYKRCDICNKIKKQKQTAEYYQKNKKRISEYKKNWYIGI